MSYTYSCSRYRSKRIFIDPESISRHLHCSVCQDVFDDPVRTICGHTFCYVCIQQWALLKINCPLCKKPIGSRKLEKDLLAAAIVDDLEVKCFYEQCQWKGPEALRSKHQRTCEYKPKNYVNSSLPVVEVRDQGEEVEEIQDQSLQVMSGPVFSD